MAGQLTAIVDTGGANLASLQYALKRINVDCCVTRDRTVICNSSHVILPGVGAAGDSMKNIRDAGLVDVIKELSQPVLGICLGMHLLGLHSEENQAECLGIIDAPVVRLTPNNEHPVPHMGWNQIQALNDCPLLEGLGVRPHFYFVHSFAMPILQSTSSSYSYMNNYSATLRHKNFFATQFHPERSAASGQRLLKNFLELSA